MVAGLKMHPQVGGATVPTVSSGYHWNLNRRTRKLNLGIFKIEPGKESHLHLCDWKDTIVVTLMKYNFSCPRLHGLHLSFKIAELSLFWEKILT